VILMNLEEWRKMIGKERMEKDMFFKTHSESPIPLEERVKFKGLSYYPPNPKYKFVIPLHEHKEKIEIQVMDTAGQIRIFKRWGEFRFVIDGKEYKLQVYTNNPLEEELFIPFKDTTNGKETYSAGRYLDLYYHRDRTPGGNWILDFNKAYNPWCAYNTKYACPFVPPENWLNIPIPAGEKDYKRGDSNDA